MRYPLALRLLALCFLTLASGCEAPPPYGSPPNIVYAPTGYPADGYKQTPVDPYCREALQEARSAEREAAAAAADARRSAYAGAPGWAQAQDASQADAAAAQAARTRAFAERDCR